MSAIAAYYAEKLQVNAPLGPIGVIVATGEFALGIAMLLVDIAFNDLDEDINGHGYNSNDIFILNYSVYRISGFFNQLNRTLLDSYTAIVDATHGVGNMWNTGWR